MVGERRNEIIEEICRKYNELALEEIDINWLKERMILAIDPSKSHTFRKGKRGVWRDVYTEKMKTDF